MAEQSNGQNSRQQVMQALRKQAIRQVMQKAKQEIAKKVAAKVGKQAIMHLIKVAFLAPPFVGWIVLAIIMILIFVFLVLSAMFGENAAQASDNHRAVGATDDSHAAYVALEGQSYTGDSDGDPDTNGDDRMKDEYAYKLPWGVLEELDSYMYGAKATADERQEIFNALKSKYSGDRTDYDVYNTYKAKAVMKTVMKFNPDTGLDEPVQELDHYEWDANPAVKKVQRHIIPQAQTWEGTFSRSYSQVHTDGRVAKPRPDGPNDTVQETYIWQFEDTSENIDYAMLKGYIKQWDPGVWDAQVSMVVGVIQILMGQEATGDTGEGGGGISAPFDGGGGMSVPKNQFIQTILPGAQETYKKYHVLPSITLAQATLESGWGQYHIGSANNLFGIKANSSWDGPFVTVPTKEWTGSEYITIMAKFRSYPSFAESVEDHGKFLKDNSRYVKVLAATDYRVAAQELQNAGYATSPVYAKNLINMIECYGWNKYDQ